VVVKLTATHPENTAAAKSARTAAAALFLINTVLFAPFTD
jgi:hypothetical protein